ncbi:ImmA/IrrE family metallo-endopeptidase [Rhizobium wuzhouense]|uniref:IrrE N-terminal-like domain-containing protein n=1 Tax=Rhizobium wuzhouense TaxID=1986026 RepID=A0ABX5NM96_9HYPH|nr:ImmA/IrrE family metallo-endopeptidase [Rhizobium wuzhouense]PYB70011.1 hypothetical protein DMY87_22245 [Rhizobium wuzhouense]
MRPKIWLKPTRAQEIRRIVEDLLLKVKFAELPVPVEAVAKTLDISVKFAPYSEGDLAGMLILQPRPTIAVNSAHHRNRQRFTIAHEIGHFLLHKKESIHIDEKMAVLYRDKNSSMAINPQEVEANHFAAELLMPKRILLKDLANKQIDLEEDEILLNLAKRYGVSQQAMAFRIANILS